TGLLAGAYASGSLHPTESLPQDPTETLDQGVAGQAGVTGAPCRPGDSLPDQRFRPLPVIDRYIKAARIRSVMAVPLIGGSGPFGALLVSSVRAAAWAEADSGLLARLADQGS